MVHLTSKRLRVIMAGSLVLMYLAGLTLALSGVVFPYSGGETPAPKRLFLQVSLWSLDKENAFH